LGCHLFARIDAKRCTSSNGLRGALHVPYNLDSRTRGNDGTRAGKTTHAGMTKDLKNEKSDARNVHDVPQNQKHDLPSPLLAPQIDIAAFTQLG